MKLYSKIHGDSGQPLIIIHGLFGMSDNWNSLGKKFSKYYRVHLVDLRNHGRSPHSVEFDYEVMCKDLIDYIRDNNIQKPILLGHSLGGKVVMKFAFSYPKEVAKLIVCDIAPREYSVDFHEDLLSKIIKVNLDDCEKRSDVEEALINDIPDFRIRSFVLKNLYRDVNIRFAWRFNVKVLIQQISNIKEASFLKGQCDIETLFVRGESSNYINKEDESLIQKHFSNLHFKTINRAGHWVHAENPNDFYSQVFKFCSN